MNYMNSLRILIKNKFIINRIFQLFILLNIQCIIFLLTEGIYKYFILTKSNYINKIIKFLIII